MTSVFSWQNSVSLCPASFCTPRPKLPVTPGVSCLPIFCIPVPYIEKDIFFGVLVLKGPVGLHRPSLKFFKFFGPVQAHTQVCILPIS